MKETRIFIIPVSYTHLDVYKRQDLKPGSPVTVDGIYTDMSVMVDVTYHETVSYTHLDVYKRQAYGGDQERPVCR